MTVNSAEAHSESAGGEKKFCLEGTSDPRARAAARLEASALVCIQCRAEDRRLKISTQKRTVRYARMFMCTQTDKHNFHISCWVRRSGRGRGGREEVGQKKKTLINK